MEQERPSSWLWHLPDPASHVIIYNCFQVNVECASAVTCSAFRRIGTGASPCVPRMFVLRTMRRTRLQSGPPAAGSGHPRSFLSSVSPSVSFPHSQLSLSLSFWPAPSPVLTIVLRRAGLRKDTIEDWGFTEWISIQRSVHVQNVPTFMHV
ncbi:unnamed protein product [Nesidiocoris tenuis]|uniref:Uncharacterized protein n=1 Tax=Nesidiocoris tenuis TaxID=355587 RepID=A0A6H5HDN7_9HEMI|nr:unnamed protein product [Nesidiocoris tenuis]